MVFSESRFAPMQVKFDVGPAGRMTINHPTTRSNRTRPIELHTSLRENLQRRALTRSPSATKGDELNGGYTALFRAADSSNPTRPPRQSDSTPSVFADRASLLARCRKCAGNAVTLSSKESLIPIPTQAAQERRSCDRCRGRPGHRYRRRCLHADKHGCRRHRRAEALTPIVQSAAGKAQEPSDGFAAEFKRSPD